MLFREGRRFALRHEWRATSAVRALRLLIPAAVLLSHCRPVAPHLPQTSAPVPMTCTAPAVATSSGVVCGLQQSVTAWQPPTVVQAYLGIPYAESTAGDHRWSPPLPYAARPGVRDATAFGPLCPQPAHDTAIEQSEDCLRINVWTPAATAPANGWPVMAFIHGGSFLVGGSRAGVLDGARLAARGPVVVVSFNYRLGALGFLAGLDHLEGNYGFLDQQLALRWVRDNIGAFGGDPQRVTLFGESAGAMSVGLHLIAPASRDLFRAAILESNPYGIPYKGVAEARSFATVLREELGCADIGCMRRASTASILARQGSDRLLVDGLLEGLSGELVWAPTVDGTTIPIQPSAVTATLPMLIGTNVDEGEVFVLPFRLKLPFTQRQVMRVEYEAFLHLLFSAAVVDRIERTPRYAPIDGDNTEVFAQVLTDYLFTCANQYVMSAARAPVFGYQFAYAPTYDVWPGIPRCAPPTGRVCHAFELPFVFDNPTTVLVRAPTPSPASRFAAPDQAVADLVTAYWTRFAATLDPNRADLPSWPAYRADDRARLVIGTSVSPARDLGAACDLWNAVGYDTKGLFERLGLDAPARSPDR